MGISRDDVMKALAAITDPSTGKNIVESGMVATVATGDEGISVTLSPPRVNNPFINSLRSKCVETLKEHFGADLKIHAVKIAPHSSPKKEEAPVAPARPMPGVRNIIAVSSGKGGVGKSTVAVNLSIALALQGYKTGLLDADVFGPSIPLMLNSGDQKPGVRREDGVDIITPLELHGIKTLSTGFFVSATDAVVWRGPMASSFLKQLIEQGEWGNLDYLIIDLPPGTSDIHLTMVQELPVTGAIVVTTPQKVALADAVKGIAMFRSEKIEVPVLGLVENMSWFTPAELPDNRYYIFGRDGGTELSAKEGVPLLGQIPVVQSICEGGDSGNPVALRDDEAGRAFRKLAVEVVREVEKRNLTARPTKRVEITKK